LPDASLKPQRKKCDFEQGFARGLLAELPRPPYWNYGVWWELQEREDRGGEGGKGEERVVVEILGTPVLRETVP